MGKNGHLKLLVTTDFHGSRGAFEKTFQKAKEIQPDALFVCGDITHFEPVQQGKELLSRLVTLQLPILYVVGNTDLPELTNLKIKGADDIHATCKSIGDYSFIGVSALHPTFDVPEEKIMRWLQSGINACSQTGNLIVVSHVPPINTKVDIAYIGGHTGSHSLRQFILERKPVAVFCGHIHEARGIDYIGNTIIVNPGPARHGYYALVTLNGKVDVELARF
jgi:Icc-related predicted phosphoesterase